ncbi:MAG: MBOAT family protein [Anaerolineae bacterium]|nr:MBOAT family protein [Anaerolineae bacterium]GIK37230.1 MAG: alginate O-acetyltransferase [Chloroflexota bacterium]
MLFNSIEFLLFFPIVVALYFACPDRYRWALLLAASYYFYAAWKLEYIVLLIAATLISYITALLMVKSENQAQRTVLLVIGLCSNLGILFAFKYFNFVNDSLRAAFNQFNLFYNVPMFQALLPVGISFYTFLTLGYVIDVYRGKLEPERHLGRFALFVAFFPQLLAGPIERAVNMLPQFYKKFDFDEARISSGLRLMLWGMFQKVVIADRLGLYVNTVYDHPAEWAGWPVLLATFFFAFQIYCDFSGYSDIAIGAARVLGFNLMENFRRPYFAQSPSEFWGRWHISLSTWFRDYLYISLGGNRVSLPRWYLNLMIVFLVSGLWHGAAWTFVLWGGLHGLYVVGDVASKSLRGKLAQRLGLDRQPTIQVMLSGFVTFSLVCLAWVFFRANSVAEAFLLLNNLLPLTNFAQLNAPWAAVVSNPTQQMALSLGLILLLMTVHWVQEQQWSTVTLWQRPLWFRWAAYLGLTLAIMNLGITEEVPFIYFQF